MPPRLPISPNSWGHAPDEIAKAITVYTSPRKHKDIDSVETSAYEVIVNLATNTILISAREPKEKKRGVHVCIEIPIDTLLDLQSIVIKALRSDTK